MVGNSCQGWMETFVPAAERQQTGLYLLFQAWSPIPAPPATPEGLVTGKTSHTAVLAMGCKDPCADLKQLPLVRSPHSPGVGGWTGWVKNRNKWLTRT